MLVGFPAMVSACVHILSPSSHALLVAAGIDHPGQRGGVVLWQESTNTPVIQTERATAQGGPYEGVLGLL